MPIQTIKRSNGNDQYNRKDFYFNKGNYLWTPSGGAAIPKTGLTVQDLTLMYEDAGTFPIPAPIGSMNGWLLDNANQISVSFLGSQNAQYGRIPSNDAVIPVLVPYALPSSQKGILQNVDFNNNLLSKRALLSLYETMAMEVSPECYTLVAETNLGERWLNGGTDVTNAAGFLYEISTKGDNFVIVTSPNALDRERNYCYIKNNTQSVLTTGLVNNYVSNPGKALRTAKAMGFDTANEILGANAMAPGGDERVYVPKDVYTLAIIAAANGGGRYPAIESEPSLGPTANIVQLASCTCKAGDRVVIARQADNSLAMVIYTPKQSIFIEPWQVATGGTITGPTE